MRRVWAVCLVVVLAVCVLPVAVSADDGVDIGASAVIGMSEPEQLPDIAGDIAQVFGLIAPTSIGSQANYPYTGGAFIAATTNYGTGLMVLAEPYKVNTFGYLKGTDRVVNLTPSTISGYWIMGSTTYQLRFTALGQAEYYYNLSTPYAWRTLTVSAVTDTNIQFLDETGERGIQRPYLTLQDRILIVFIVMEIAIHAVALVRRR